MFLAFGLIFFGSKPELGVIFPRQSHPLARSSSGLEGERLLWEVHLSQLGWFLWKNWLLSAVWGHFYRNILSNRMVLLEVNNSLRHLMKATCVSNLLSYRDTSSLIWPSLDTSWDVHVPGVSLTWILYLVLKFGHHYYRDVYNYMPCSRRPSRQAIAASIARSTVLIDILPAVVNIGAPPPVLPSQSPTNSFCNQ